MYEAHDALICIAEGAYVDQQTPRRRLTAQHYFKSPEMATLFADLPEALKIQSRLSNAPRLWRTGRDPIPSKFAEDEVQELRHKAKAGLENDWP